MRPHVDGSLSSDTLFVYPTALKVDDVARDAARSSGCLLGHRITTFPQLVDALAHDLGVGGRVLEPHLAAVVLARALQQLAPTGPLGSPGAGLLRELLTLIEELEAACLGPEDVAAIATGLRDTAAAARVAEIARAYDAYTRELARIGAVDRRGRERAVWEGLVASEKSGRRPALLAGVRRIVFAELYDFSALQFLLATALIRVVGDAELIAFAHPENVDATRFVERTWNRFVADASISEQVLPSFVARGGRQGNLAAVLRGVFAEAPPASVAPDGSIRVVAAPGRYAEVEAAVRDVRRRLEGGKRAERIAIIVRNLAVYGELIEDVCRRYRVPVYFRKGRPLLASGVVGACLDVLRCATDGFPRARLAAVLESDYFRHGGGVLARTLGRIGFVSERARPLAECLEHESTRLANRAAAKSGAERDRIETQREHLARDTRRLEDVVAALRPLDGRRPLAAHVRALKRALRRLGFRPVASHDLSPVAARRDALASALLDETLDGLAGLADAMRLGPIDLDEFTRTLVASLDALEIEDRSERAGSVRALGVLDARGLDFDAVYVLGLDDGTFPAARSESPLCPDALKRLMNPLAADRLRATLAEHVAGLPLGGLLRTARESSLEEPFLFFLTLSMAERELVLSYPAVDESGSATVRSPFLDEVDACLGGGLIPARADPGRIVPELRDACEAGELIGRAVLERWTRSEPDRLTPVLRADPAVGAVRMNEIDRRAAIEDGRARYFLARPGAEKDALASGFVGRLAVAAPALAARLDGQRWHPTSLEQFATCGFKFFAARVLGLEDGQPPTLEVDFRERGTLFHAVVAELFRRHPVLPIDLDAARALARREAGGVRRAVAQTIGAKDPAFLDVEWEQIGRALDGVVVCEHAIQQEYAASGITVDHLVETELRATFGPVALIGRPDRVELHRRGDALVEILVRDYKLSGERQKYGKLAGEQLGRTSLQIPVYLLLAQAHVGAEGRDARLGGSYVLARAVGERQIVPCAVTPGLVGAGTPGDGGAILARLTELVERAHAGRFDVDPEPCDPYCAFRGVCRYQEPPLAEEEPEDG